MASELSLLVLSRRSRASLMRSTALQAAALAVLASPAAAQLAVNARPTGGQVSAGQASIANTASKTLITQSTQNAAINWQAYNVGAGQTVQYVQPNARSLTLNRVVGPDPSQIAGKILANGQIVLLNQSGVVFSKGAQVDTAGLVVTTAGITDKNFMAGHLVFDQAGHPGASISNAGNITVRQAGLAALVAPQVANAGVISARLGRVILGGAETHTLDLYGDGLVALNVTGQVTKASLGGRQVAALVTNTGTILAPGGTVVLSASAVDGVVTNLVEAGGRVSAQSVGDQSAGPQTGRVLVQGIGGGISIDGEVSATGIDAGTKGGQVVASATGAVRVGQAARVDASGDQGGGVIALGTTAARAIGGAAVQPAMVAQSVSLMAGSHVSANARRRGAGGRVAVFSRTATTQAGDISARGGASGGDGGWIEVSGGKVGFGGLLDAGAAFGKAGSILIDPADLQIGGTQSENGTITYLSPAAFGQFTGDVILKADGQLTVAGAVTTNTAVRTLELEGDQGIAINAALNAPGVAVGLQTFGAITEGPGGIITAASLAAAANRGISLTGANQIGAIGIFDNTTATARTLTGEVASLSDGVSTTRAPTTTDALTLQGLAAFDDITLDNAQSLTISAGGSIVAGGDIAVTVSGTTIGANTGIVAPNTLSVGADIDGNNVTLATTGVGPATYAGTAFSQTAGTILASGQFSDAGPVAGTVSISTAQGALSIGGTILTQLPQNSDLVSLAGVAQDGATTLTALSGNITEAAGGSIITGTLSGSSSKGGGTQPGDANFAIANGNTITTLTAFTSTGNFALEDDSGLVVNTLQADGDIAINGPVATPASVGGVLALEGAVTSGGNILLSNALGIAEVSGGSVTATGAVTLISQNAIAQQTLSSLTAGTALTIDANGTTDFATQIPGAGLAATSGFAFAGGLSGATVLLSAAGGNLAEAATGQLTAGTLAAASSGNISLASSDNHISNIGSLDSAQDSFTLNGLFAGGTTGITIVDDSSLNILADTTGEGATPVVLATTAGASVSINVTQANRSESGAITYGSLTVGTFGTSTMVADGSILLQATGNISQGPGVIQATNGALGVISSHGDIGQTGAVDETGAVTVIAAAGTTLTVSAAGSVSQSAAALSAGGNATISAGGDVTQSQGVIAAGGDLTVTATGGNIVQSNLSTMTAAGELGLFATQGAFSQSQSGLFGTHGVGLTFGGDVDSENSTIRSNGAADDATSGTIAISAGGSMVLDSSVAAGPGGAVLLSAAGAITELSADGSFSGAIVAPSLSAGAGGSLTLTGPNQVLAINAAGPLTGLSAGSGNLDFRDTTDLSLAAGASLTALGGTILVGVSGAHDAISDGAIVQASGNVTLNVAGVLSQAGGVFQSEQADVIVTSGSFAQTAGAALLAAGNVQIAPIVGSTGGISQSADSRISAGQTLSMQSFGDITITGTLQAGSLSNGVYGGAVGLAAGGNILGGGETVLAGTLAAAAAGNIALGGAASRIAEIGLVGTLSGLLGGIVTLQDGQSLLVNAGIVGTGGVSITVPTADITVAQGVTLTGLQAPLSLTAGGAILTGGELDGAGIALSAGGALTEQAGGAIVSTGTAQLAAGTMLTLGGNLSATGATRLSAGTDILETVDGVIQTTQTGTTASAATLTAPGTITLDGLVSVAGSLRVAAGSFLEDGSGAITAGVTDIAGTDSTIVDGRLTANGALSLTSNTDVTIGQTGIVNAGDTAINLDSGAATIDGLLTARGTLDVTTRTDFTLAQGAAVTAESGSIAAATGNTTIDGVLNVDGSLLLVGGNNFTLGQTGSITAGATTVTAAFGAATLDGVLTANGTFSLDAGNGLTLGQTGTLSASSDISLGAGTGAAVIAGKLTATGALDLNSDGDISLAPSAALTAGDTTISGGAAVTIDGVLAALGPLTLTAATNVSEGRTGVISGNAVGITATSGSVTIAGVVQSFFSGFTLAAGTDFTVAAGGSVTGDLPPANGAYTVQHGPGPAFAGVLTAGGNATIDGTLSNPEVLTLSAGNAFTLGADGRIAGGNVSITASTGAVTIDGALVPTGNLSLSAGTSIIDASAITSGGDTSLSAGGDIDLSTSLSSPGSLTIAAGGAFDLQPGVVVTATGARITAGTTVSVDGSLAATGAIAVAAAGAIDEGPGGSLSGGPISLTSRAGAIDINGAITSRGAFLIDAGTNIVQGAGSTIADIASGTQTASSALRAPGTISLSGTLSADSLTIGDIVSNGSDPVTQAIVWNNTTVKTGSNAGARGATRAISVALPLRAGAGAGGVYLDAASFRQDGVSTVSAISGTAAPTLQLTLQGHGAATFASLKAPTAQMLLVLNEGGTASGLIDVAGLNLYYAPAILPLQVASLQGAVGGSSGFMAAETSFAHPLTSVNYQLNGCAIGSATCGVFTLPTVPVANPVSFIVPIVDPVNDYAEGTQRRRHQDDDALPNVGEEDY